MNPKTALLVQFANRLKFRQEKISKADLEYEIMVEYGHSRYFVNSTLKALEVLRLIKIDPSNNQVWIINGSVGMERKAEKEIEAEVDQLLEKR
jgi:hypothetical protein